MGRVNPNINIVDQFPRIPVTVTDEHQTFPGAYDWQNVFEDYPGDLLLPAAGPDSSPPRVVKTHAAYGMRTLIWVAVRLGKLPILPDPAPIDPANEVLKHKEIVPCKPGIMPDGVNHYFMVSGVYTYWQRVPTKIDQGILLGRGPEDLSGEKWVLKTPNFKNFFK